MNKAAGTDNRRGHFYVSNSVAVTPEISGGNFWIDVFVKDGNMEAVSRSIRVADQAGEDILFEMKTKISKIKGDPKSPEGPKGK